MIVLFNIHGGFGTEPRWGQNVRKGKMHCEIKKVLTYDEYKANRESAIIE